jgi:hypothetical protein
MMRNTQPIRTRLLTAVLAGMVSAGVATAASAANAAAGTNAKAGADAQAASPAYVQAAEAHVDAYSTNANAQGQDDATRGADRAAERAGMNTSKRVPSVAAEPAADARSVAQAKRPASR